MAHPGKLWQLIDQFLTVIHAETGFPVIIYDTTGHIVMATDCSRLGDLHAGAKKMMGGETREYAVTPEEAAANPLVREGYSCLIEDDGEVVAGFGITGKLDLARPIAKIAVKTIQAWIQELRVQEQLTASERKYREIFAGAMYGIFQSTPEGRFLTANPALASLLGYPSVESLLANVTDIGGQIYVDPESRQRFLETVVSEGRVAGFLSQLRRTDGELIDVITSARMVTGESGKAYIEGQIVDVTAQRRAEAAIRLSEEKYAKAFNNSPVWVVLSTLQDGRYLEVNESFLDTMGFNREEVVGKSSLALDTWVNPADRASILEQLRQKGRVAEQEVLRRTSDGTVLTMLYWGEVISVGDDQCLLSVSLDITERKRAQEAAVRLESALAQSQKMEAIGTLAGGIAHDFNNILSVIVGYAQLGLAKLDPNHHLHRNIEQILLAGLRARDLVGQILAYSRQQQLELLPLQLGSLVKETVKMLRATLPTTIEIDTIIAPGLANIMADPTQIQQILINLCTNGAQAMEKNGGRLTITLEPGPVAMTAEGEAITSQPGFLRLQISDTGCGIPTEMQDRIFDPYFTTKPPGKGTGLGLSVVQGIVSACDGTITVASEPGHGTTFTLTFPTVADSHQGETECTAGPLPRGAERILLVDDEPTILEIVERLLVMLGYRVLPCREPHEALELVTAGTPFDLVISDVTMPRMTGLELVRKLREQAPALPVILCSGYSSGLTPEYSAELGVAAFLVKPVILEELAQTVRQVLDARHQETRPAEPPPKETTEE